MVCFRSPFKKTSIFTLLSTVSATLPASCSQPQIVHVFLIIMRCIISSSCGDNAQDVHNPLNCSNAHSDNIDSGVAEGVCIVAYFIRITLPLSLSLVKYPRTFLCFFSTFRYDSPSYHSFVRARFLHCIRFTHSSRNDRNLLLSPTSLSHDHQYPKSLGNRTYSPEDPRHTGDRRRLQAPLRYPSAMSECGTP